MKKLKLQKVKFEKCDIFELSYNTRIGEKPLRIHLNRIRGEFVLLPSPELFLKLGAQPTIIVIFDKIKKEIKKMKQSANSLYINFNKIKVLNKEKVSLNLLMYMQEVSILFKNIKEDTYYPQVYLNKVSIMKEVQISAAVFISLFPFPVSLLEI